MSTTVQVNERLAALTAAGTSVWLDQIRRSMITGGELRRLVDEYSLRGVTSNPAIFEKAILGSPDYDEQLEQLARSGASGREVYRHLAVTDVQLAADVLRGVWERAGHRDGFVSLEVAPRLAHDTEGTMEQARLYWGLVERPNVMIKIPGTDEGVPAIEEMVYEGLNINVTLLFSVAAYERVAEAYIRGLERRHAEDLPLDVHSVASFFVSRVDTEVDRRLEALDRSDLEGLAAVANARAAYRRFRDLFGGERFAALRAAGAHAQRPLWASTGVKNPRYPDTKYVDSLVGSETVNTMPLPTLLAVAERGRITGATAELDPRPDLERLAGAGIDMDDVTDTLLAQGIAAFKVPMEKMLAGVEARRVAVVTGAPRAIEVSIPDPGAQQAIADRVAEAARIDLARRIWCKDPTVWGAPGEPEIADRLGWLTTADTMLEHLGGLEELAREVAAEGTSDVVLLGMGGSSLAPEVIRASFGPVAGFPRLHVLDSTDPGAIRAVEESIDLERTLFVVSTKSGTTIETLSLFRHFHERRPDGERFVAVTDPGSPLEELAARHGFRRTFLADPDIGGRYSALSHFGLVPAALAGADVTGMLQSAGVAEQASAAFDSSESNSGLWLGLTVGELALRGRDKLTFIVSEPIASFGLWAEQLVAESTGKRGRGILPVADEPPAPPGDYGPDRTFIYLRNNPAPEERLEAHVKALIAAGHPVLTVGIDQPADLGRLFFLAEFATAAAGWVLGINPFDQPNVQEAKDATGRVLAEYRERGALPEIADADAGALAELLDGAGPPHYVAVLGYLPPSDEVEAAVGDLREALRRRTGAATTFGYGPRYLHSTGQLHKGGPPVGRFLQLLSEPASDLDVPGAPYTFGVLEAAQAAGDLITLRAHGLPARRVRLRGHPAEAIRRLTATIEGLG